MIGEVRGQRSFLCRARACASALLIAVAFSSCSPNNEAAVPNGVDIERLEALLADGREAGMSDQQEIVLLDAIDEVRMVTFEEYKTARMSEIACLESLGFTITELRETSRAGWTEITFLYGGFQTSEEGDALLPQADACFMKHSNFVGLAYQMNESLVHWDRTIEEYRTALEACVRDRGTEVASELEAQELLALDYERSVALGYSDACADEVGLTKALVG